MEFVMSQPKPVIRQLYWPGLIPQLLAVAVLSVATWLVLPATDLGLAIFVGAIVYLIFCRLMRWSLVRDHTQGMRAYQAGRFQDAIFHFEASHRFFSDHRRLDACRSLLFGVASQNSYRVIALGNMAYCYGQLGDGGKAIELFERVLQEMPEHAVAKSSLNLLRASVPRMGAAQSAVVLDRPA
jgi:tetratricopeptide (TPR) repeat protein